MRDKRKARLLGTHFTRKDAKKKTNSVFSRLFAFTADVKSFGWLSEQGVNTVKDELPVDDNSGNSRHVFLLQLFAIQDYSAAGP